MSNPAIKQAQGAQVPAKNKAAKNDIKQTKASAPASVFEPPKSESSANTIAPKAHPTKQTANVPLLEDKKEPEKQSAEEAAMNYNPPAKTTDDSISERFQKMFG